MATQNMNSVHMVANTICASPKYLINFMTEGRNSHELVEVRMVDSQSAKVFAVGEKCAAMQHSSGQSVRPDHQIGVLKRLSASREKHETQVQCIPALE